jgi:hypothetical protein
MTAPLIPGYEIADGVQISGQFLRWLEQLRQDMADGYKRQLYHGVLSNSAAELFNSDGQYSEITAATVQNVTGGAVTMDIWIVDDGGTRADATLVFEAKSIAANSAVELSELEGHVLNDGQELHGVAASASALTLRISGKQSPQ